MSCQDLTVYKANGVIEASYRLTLNEQRVVLACIGQVNSAKKLLATDRFTLSAKDFSEVYSVSSQAAYEALIDAAKSLYHRSLTIHYPQNQSDLKKLETRWISSIGYAADSNGIVLRFSQDILPYLGQLKGSFTRYKLEDIGKMSSTYAIRLYELLVQWLGEGSREIEIDWLKKQFQLDASYDRMNNFKARVLEPAIKDINEHSNLTVSWTQRKAGRRVTHLIFTFSEKKPATETAQKKPGRQRKTTEPGKRQTTQKNAAKHIKELKNILG